MIEVIIAVTILSVILLSVAEMNYQNIRQTQNLLSLSQVKIFRRKLIDLLLNDEGWRRSMVQPQNAARMNCLRQPNSTCPNVGYNPASNPRLAIFNAAGLDDETYYLPSGPAAGPVYDATVASNGITARGKKCTGFSTVTSSPACPFRFELRWYALSNTPSPLVAVYAVLLVSPNTIGNVNPNHYSIGVFVGNTLTNPLVRGAR